MAALLWTAALLHGVSSVDTDGERRSGRIRRSTTARLAEQGFVTEEPANRPRRRRRLQRVYTPEPLSPIQEAAPYEPEMYGSSPNHIAAKC